MPIPAQQIESISDEALVVQARAGSRRAEDMLMQRHMRTVARVVTRLLGSHRDVEDVVQDTFLAAFEQLDRLKDPAAFKSWVLRIAVNHCRKVIRKNRLLRSLGLAQSHGDAELAALVDRKARPDVRSELMVIDEVLRRQAAGHRVAWMLRYVEGYTVKEVAELCQCSMATANRRIAATHKRVLAVVDKEVLAHAR